MRVEKARNTIRKAKDLEAYKYMEKDYKAEIDYIYTGIHKEKIEIVYAQLLWQFPMPSTFEPSDR